MRERVQWFVEHLLHPTLRIKPFVLFFFFFRSPLGTVLLMSLHLAATARENDGSMDPEVSDGWSKLVECELKVSAKLVVNELKGCLVKLEKDDLMHCLTILLVKTDAWGNRGRLGEERADEFY